MSETIKFSKENQKIIDEFNKLQKEALEKAPDMTEEELKENYKINKEKYDAKIEEDCGKYLETDYIYHLELKKRGK